MVKLTSFELQLLHLQYRSISPLKAEFSAQWMWLVKHIKYKAGVWEIVTTKGLDFLVHVGNKLEVVGLVKGTGENMLCPLKNSLR